MSQTNQFGLWDDIKEMSDDAANVKKFVFTLPDAVVESVLYKYPTYEDRTVICCSTQSGCPVGCRFCGAGDYFVRSLTAEEIVSQPKYLLDQTGVDPTKIEKLQIMFMSMGEPMHNIDQLSIAIRQLEQMYPQARLLISTSGPRLFAAFEKVIALSVEVPAIGLQFSIHESTDEARAKLIPTKTLKLEEMAEIGARWAVATGRRPFFNFCVHPGNDTQEDVDRLVALFPPAIWEATISVICERDEHVAAANERQRELASQFMSKMLMAEYSTRMFDPAGQDTIGGGCGQLWYVQDWMKDNPDKAKKSGGFGLPKLHTPRPCGAQ